MKGISLLSGSRKYTHLQLTNQDSWLKLSDARVTVNQCRHGFIEGWYRTGDLIPYGQNRDVKMGEAVISLREASRLENPNKVERKKCRCQVPCGKNCFCVKNNLKCSSHCHPSKTCSNVESKPFVKPTLGDRKILGDGKELTDKHMYAAQHPLKKRFPHNHGFRDTLMLQTTRTPEEHPDHAREQQPLDHDSS